MRGVGSIALARLGEDEPPVLTRDELMAFACWRFMGGWRPELLPAYALLYPLPDPEMTLELLYTIRDERAARNG